MKTIAMELDLNDETGIWQGVLDEDAYTIMGLRLEKLQGDIDLYIEKRNRLDKIVYFAQDTKTQHIKIGITTNLFQRLNSIQMERNTIFELLFHTRGNSVIEGEIHKRFSHLNVYGELYKPEKELLEFISNMRDRVTPEDVTYYKW